MEEEKPEEKAEDKKPWDMQEYDEFNIKICKDGSYFIEALFYDDEGEADIHRYTARNDKYLQAFIREYVVKK